MRYPELLSPAGEYEGLVGAVNAGADAVYLGAERYGARAYAHNFTAEELLRGIRFAHLRGCGVYLTVNTLCREKETDGIASVMDPLVEQGLDGAIVQDIGVFSILRRRYPRLRLHASTQMAVTGIYGAGLLKELGASRVVPARELSLKELSAIRRSTGLEIEAFIHGAMCYSVSGMCLFSAMLGGRSGNRGRCAGPCRLPYELPGDEAHRTPYPLSLRDMCTLPDLHRLLVPGTKDGDAVIDSMKIEGRMKDPVYTAGVTSVYRRAVDAILEDPERPWTPAADDLTLLKGLYLRSDLSGGYYERHNGAEMITGQTPGYIGSDDTAVQLVRERYLEADSRIEAEVHVRIRADEPLMIEITAKGGRRGRRVSVSTKTTGVPVQRAQNRPLTEQTVRTQTDRFGTSSFVPSEISIDLEDGVFVPVSAINDCRRRACSAQEEALLKTYGDAS